MPLSFSARLRALAATTAVLVTAGVLFGAPPAQADTAPDAGVIPTVSSDVLPTVQIDGIIWSTVIVGNTVYAGGSFANARPAGNAAGVGNIARSNLLAFNLQTGALITSFNPTVNGTVNSVAASPDGSRLYIGGAFTTVNGVTRNRVAAFDTATGSLVTAFAPSFNATVQAVTATNSTVFVGGSFTAVGGTTRTRVAAVSASSGALTAFNASADAQVLALALSPDGGKLVIGGHFTTLNGSNNPGLGMGAVNTTTGASVAWNVNSLIRQGGANGAIYSLKSDSTGVYGTAYFFPVSGQTLEGAFHAEWNNGNLLWLESCSGDSYDVAVNSTTMYLAGHPHDCSSVPSGFPDTNPRQYHRGMAWNKNATGAVTVGGAFPGQPTSTILDWWPDFNTGTVSGSSQGPWSIAANDNYVVYAGEFTRVNNVVQQGIVRFATPAIAPNTDGPRLSGSSYVPSLTPGTASGSVDIKIQTNWDRDNKNLTYQFYRDGSTTTPIYTVTAASRANFDRPILSFTDTGLVAGSSHSYRVRVTDPKGNTVIGNSVTINASAAGSVSSYATAVKNDGASLYYRLGDSSGTAITDWAGANNGTAAAGVTLGQAGAIGGDTTTAARFSGTDTGYVAATTSTAGTAAYSTEAWFRTSSTTGGILYDASSSNTATASGTRQVSLDAAGHVLFAASSPGFGTTGVTLTTTGTFNNNAWHHVVATVGGAGATLYVDGNVVAQNTTVVNAGTNGGFWKVGGDGVRAAGAPGTPATFTPTYLAATIDEFALYPTALTATQVAQHYTLSGRSVTGGGNVAPTANFTSTASGLAVAFNASTSTDTDGTISSYAWTFGDSTSGTGVSPNHTYAAAGSYAVTLTVTDNAGATAVKTAQVVVSTTPTNAAPVASFTSSVSDLTTSVTSTSTDSDGTIAQYAYTFGDGGTASTANASHTYAAAGTYPVTLTVTDNAGSTGTTTSNVTVTAAPTGGTTYATDTFGRTVTGGLGTAEVGGAWTLGSSATNYAVNGSTARITVPAGSTRLAYLAGVSSTDTDMQATASVTRPTSGSVYAGVIARRVGTADYRARAVVAAAGTVTLQVLRTDTTLSTVSVSGLSVATGDQLRIRVQAVGISPTTLRAKVWKVGATEPTAWQVTTTDSTANLQSNGYVGLYGYYSSSAQPTSTVISFDNVSATASSTVVTPPAGNVAPVASFTSSASDLAVNFTSTSTDSDGTISSSAWNFGDSATATGATTSHTYATAGTYPVALTVTDNGGLTNTRTVNVTVTAGTTPPAAGVIASDDFARSTSANWGTATLGGAWTNSSSTSASYSTDGSVGRLNSLTASKTLEVYLQGVTSTSVDVQSTIALDPANAGGSVFASVIGRRVGTADYRARAVVASGGAVTLQLQRSGTSIVSSAISGLTYNAGDQLTVRLQVVGTGTTTLRAKVWKVGTTEPTAWQATTTDTTAALQVAGYTGLGSYVGSGITTLPQAVSFDNFTVTTVQ
ncbi:beta strand repeat-containing protein [Naasia lichenicola]|uniref:PKD domain-containing protein n=1 Tax=Naasia lichenicola TaxID=2565933 RepID=A0A4V3WT65_9MICO|nr:PKD domain-containing protein [Naasia lichenicola]THG30797.1 PKD domain-containing protein [Naasia lichenicola]